MVGTMIVSLLSTLGILLIVLCAAGAVLLPAGGKGYSVLFADGSAVSRKRIRAYFFLLRTGLSRLPLMVVDCGLGDEDRSMLQRAANGLEIRLFTLQEWENYREMERKVGVHGS